MFKFDKLFGIYKETSDDIENIFYLGKSNVIGKYSYVDYEFYKMRLLELIYDYIVEEDDYFDNEDHGGDFKYFFTTKEETLKYIHYLNTKQACKHSVVDIDIESFLEN